jgi:hypothetical protein
VSACKGTEHEKFTRLHIVVYFGSSTRVALLGRMVKQNYVMTFAGSKYRLGKLDAEQMGAIQMLIQAVTFQPADKPITEDARHVRIDGDAGPVLILDRRAILNR